MSEAFSKRDKTKEKENTFINMVGQEVKEVPDTRTKREKLIAQEQRILKFLSPQEQEEYLVLVEEYEEKYPNIFAEIDESEGPKDEKFTRIKDLREKANKAWQDTPEYKSVVEGQK